MKTTLVIQDSLMRRLKALAAGRGRTLSSLVEEYLRRSLEADTTQPAATPEPYHFPSFDMGEALVDFSDREALDAVLDDDDKPEGGGVRR